MKFLTQQDIQTVLRQDEISLVEDQNTFNYYETASITMVETFIGGIYDLEQEWLKSGYNRNPFLLKCVLTLFLYEFYNVLSSVNVPFNIEKRYNEIMNLLQLAGTNKQPLFGLIKRSIELDPMRTTYRSLSNPKKLNTFNL